MMYWVDYAIVAIIASSALVSLMRGFLCELLSVLVWFSACALAIYFYPNIAPYCTFFQKEWLRQGVAFILLLFASLICGGLLNRALLRLLVDTRLTVTDRLLGVIFGCLRGGIVTCALISIVDLFFPLEQREFLQQSHLLPYFYQLAQKIKQCWILSPNLMYASVSYPLAWE